MQETQELSVQSLGWEGSLEEENGKPIPVFLPKEFHGQKTLVGYSPWGCRESDTTEWLMQAPRVWLSIFDAARGIFSCGMWTLGCSTWGLVPWPGTEPRGPVLGALAGRLSWAPSTTSGNPRQMIFLTVWGLCVVQVTLFLSKLQICVV